MLDLDFIKIDQDKIAKIKDTPSQFPRSNKKIKG